MELKKKIKIIQILLLILLIITTFIIGDTYSKYKKQIDTYYKVDIKKWYLEVNEKDIYNESSLTTILEPAFVDTTYVNDNILAPGRELFFDMNIDYSKINIEFKVTFRVQVLNTKVLSDFKIFKYILDENEITVNPVADSIEFTIDPTDDTTVTSSDLQVYLKWMDNSSNTMDNVADTEYRGEEIEDSDNTKLKFKVTATFEQVV